MPMRDRDIDIAHMLDQKALRIRERGWYTLDEHHQLVRCGMMGFMEWRWSSLKKTGVDPARVAITEFPGKITVSTVLLGLNHNIVNGEPPIVFETAVFHPGHSSIVRRYATYDEALRGHAEIVAVLEGDPKRTRS